MGQCVMMLCESRHVTVGDIAWKHSVDPCTRKLCREHCLGMLRGKQLLERWQLKTVGPTRAFVTLGKMFKQKYEGDQLYRTAFDVSTTSWLSWLSNPGVADSKAGEPPSSGQGCSREDHPIVLGLILHCGTSWAVQGCCS